MSPKNPKEKKSSQNTKNLSARLLAVQGVYQAVLNDQSFPSTADEMLEHRVSMEIDGEALVAPDGALLKKIITGVGERQSDLHDIVESHIQKENKQIEMLLRSILFCGVYELLSHQDIDAPIIINDYLNVAHAFYEPSEAGFINGILDAAAKTVRD